MRRVSESEVETDFERQFCWGDDERCFFYPNRRKASVFGYFLRIEEVLRLIRIFAPGRRVADLASAQGNFALTLAEEGYDVTAVDLHPEFLKYAQKKYTHGKFKTVNANLMDFRDTERFDCILAGEVIEHVAVPDQLLKSAWENLKPGGIVILTTPNGADYSSTLPTYNQVDNIEELMPKQFHWSDHLFLYTTEELRELLTEAGFDCVYMEKYHSAYVSQIKAIRFLFPMRFLKWLEKKTRHLPKAGKDSAHSIIAVGRKPLST
ncbi:methyltransferase domain-containing protein [bacterium]|nr:methyltransferase domain-containing protein [bacterium]